MPGKRYSVEQIVAKLREADAVQAHPLINTATMVIMHADLGRLARQGTLFWHGAGIA